MMTSESVNALLVDSIIAFDPHLDPPGYSYSPLSSCIPSPSRDTPSNYFTCILIVYIHLFAHFDKQLTEIKKTGPVSSGPVREHYRGAGIYHKYFTFIWKRDNNTQTVSKSSLENWSPPCFTKWRRSKRLPSPVSVSLRWFRFWLAGFNEI